MWLPCGGVRPHGPQYPVAGLFHFLLREERVETRDESIVTRVQIVDLAAVAPEDAPGGAELAKLEVGRKIALRTGCLPRDEHIAGCEDVREPFVGGSLTSRVP